MKPKWRNIQISHIFRSISLLIFRFKSKVKAHFHSFALCSADSLLLFLAPDNSASNAPRKHLAYAG